MFKAPTILLFLLALNACVTPPKSTTPVQRQVSGNTNEVSLDTWLFSWTNSPTAKQNPGPYVEAQLQYAADCLPKIRASKNPVKSCEGNGLYAGPGIYTCDNPFTSYDYGSTVVMLRAIPGQSHFLNHVPESYSEASSVDRDDYGNGKYAGILYDFRASDLNTKALVIRDASLIDTSQTQSVTLTTNFKKFQDHDSYVCTPQSTIPDVLNNWGDHMAFMAKIFFSALDPLGEQYIDKKNQSLNIYGWLAAVSSDAVALPEDQLQKKISALSATFADVAESLSSLACAETSTVSARACLARRLYDSARGEMGTDRRPTYAWELATTLQVFAEFGLLSTKEAAKISDHEQLMNLITTRLQSDKVAAARVFESYNCMLQARATIEKNHLGLWVPEP